MTEAAQFDLDEHRRRRLAELERRVDALEQHRQRLERVCGILALVAVGQSTCTPAALIALADELAAADMTGGSLLALADDDGPPVGAELEAQLAARAEA